MPDQISLPPSPRNVGSIWRRGKFIGLLCIVALHLSLPVWLVGRFSEDGWAPPDATLFHLFTDWYKPWIWLVWEGRYWRSLLSGAGSTGHALRAALMVGLIGSLVIWRFVPGIVVWIQVKWLSHGTENVYGSSKWGDKKDIIDAGLLPRQGQDLTGGIVLGAWAPPGSKKAVYLRDKSARHALVVAATRTGKSQSCVIPTAVEWAESMFVVDIKNEIFEATAGWRAQQGHRIVRFAPMEPENSVRINPLEFIRIGTRYEVADAQKFAQALCDPGGEAVQNSHWNDAAAMLLGGVILHEAYKCRLRFDRTATMADISYGLSPYKEKGGKVEALDFSKYLEEAMSFEHDPAGQHGWRLQSGAKTKIHPFVIDAASKALSRPTDEAGSVLSSAAKRFALYADPLISQVTSANDISIMDLVDGNKPVTFYFVVPPSEKERLAPITRVLVANVISRLTEKKRTWKWELLFLMDEFPSLGYVKPLESALSYAGGYGVRFFLICQDLGQIFKHYGSRNEIIPNCHLKMLFATGDLETAEATSKTLGDTTVLHASFNYSEQKMLPDGKGISAQSHQHHRMMLTPSEIMQLRLPVEIEKKVVKPGEFILLVFGKRPIRGVQSFWFFDPIWKERVGLPTPTVSYERPQTFTDQLRDELGVDPREQEFVRAVSMAATAVAIRKENRNR